MIKHAIYLFFLLPVLILPVPVRGNMILPQGESITTMFMTHRDATGTRCYVKGKVHSFSDFETLDNKELVDTMPPRNRVIVRLYNTTGIKKDDILYVIDENKLAVSRMVVDSIFKSDSFGMMLIGRGNFALSQAGFTVVQKVEDEYSSMAYIHRARGDYFRENSDTGKAISEYKKALVLDRGNPEAHLALGDIYYARGMYQFAFREYHEGYKNIGRLYDREDKFMLLKGMALVRFKEVFEGPLPQHLKDKYRAEGISMCAEALSVYPDSAEVNYLAGMFYYKSPSPDDKKARDFFLKAIEIDPEHAPSGIALAELYLKHRNREKSISFLQKVIESDPGNKRARELMLYIEKYAE